MLGGTEVEDLLIQIKLSNVVVKLTIELSYLTIQSFGSYCGAQGMV